MKPNKVLFYILLVSVAVFSTGCTFKVPSAGNKSVSDSTKTSDESADQNAFPKEDTKIVTTSDTPSSLNDLLALNKPQKCTWEQTIEGANISATIYVNGKSFKQELPMGTKGNFYAYSDGTTLYSWSDATTFGVKVNMEEMKKTAEDLQKGDNSSASTNVDLNKDYNFKCADWVVDSSKFVVPTEIQFVNMADFSKDLKNTIQNVDLTK